ncbi:hypothetical protein V8E55_007393 [Tylopilus felleus]
MARTAQTAKKTTGGPTKRLMLVRPEAAREPAAKLLSPAIKFCCVSCHWLTSRNAPSPYMGFTENGKPIFKTFLEVKGTFQNSTKANIHAHLAHFNIIEDALRDYYPDNGKLKSIDIPFNLASDDAQLKWPSQAGEIITHIHAASFKHVVAVVTNHTDDDRGDFWLGSSKEGKEPSAAAVDEAFSGLKVGLKSLGVQHALHLSPVKTVKLLMNVTKSVVLHDFEFVNTLEQALKNATLLGKHSGIIHVASRVTKYVWSHKDYQPWGTALPLQCPQCGLLDSWDSIFVRGGLGAYRFECKGDQCGWVKETLEEWLPYYMDAHGDPDEHAAVLKHCRNDILGSPRVKKDEIQLPTLLRLAIRKEFLPYLAEDDQAEEEAAIKAIEDRGNEKLTPDERAGTARPTEAGNYRKLWNPFHVAQRIFKEEFKRIDYQSRDKSDKKSFGACTKALREWWNSLDMKRKEEAERVAASWNAQGAPPDKQMAQVFKNLRSDTSEFLDSLRRTMGVHAMMLMAYKTADGVKTTIIETNPPMGRNKFFSVFSNETKKWAKDGGEYLAEYMFGKDEEQSESDDEDGDDDSVPVVNVDINGNPLLPSVSSRRLKARQDVVREIFRKAYIKITTRAKVAVPWLLLSKTPTEYIDPTSLPPSFRITDPSKFTKIGVATLWSHWQQQALLEFHPPKKCAYVEINSPKAEENEDSPADDIDLEDLARKGKATTSESVPTTTSHSPKRPRLSLNDQPADPEETSPAANQHDRGTFLHSLSTDQSYLKLVTAFHALPRICSNRPKSRGNLPVWASWRQAKKYLPAEVHTIRDEFHVVLGAFRRARYADAGSGTPVVLGLGLLLRECWRAVEVEPNAKGFPEFLLQSALGHERADEIVSVIKQVLDDLSSQPEQVEDVADNERALESAKKLKGKDNVAGEEKEEPQGESSKAEEGKEVRTVGKTKMKKVVIASPTSPDANHAHDPKKDSSPSRNTRSKSQRVCKPSKKFLGED